MYPATESGRSYSGPFAIDDYFFMTVFIRRAPVKHDTISKCIHTAAATYGCKILQLYEYDNELRMTAQEYQSCSIKDS